MSAGPEDGVAKAVGQTHDVPNLFVLDASQFTTGAAANPTLGIIALAIRQAEHIAEWLRTGAIPSDQMAWTSGRDAGGPAPEPEPAPEQTAEPVQAP